MSATNEFGFEYVFELASRLTPEEQAKLVRQLPKSNPVVDLGNGLKMETVSTGEPIFTPEELAEFQRRGEEHFARFTPEEIEANKQAWKRFVEEFPEIGEEEIKAMEEARKEFNECRLASLYRSLQKIRNTTSEVDSSEQAWIL